MTTIRLPLTISCAWVALALSMSAHAGLTDISTEPLNTYSASGSTDVKPNVLFILDDSGSMDWDFMPDWACSGFSIRENQCDFNGQHTRSGRHEFLFKNSAYNGVYYNPAVAYKPPVAMDADGVKDLAKYPSMKGVSTTTGGNGDATEEAPNWKAVKRDAYGVQSTAETTSDLQTDASNPPIYYTIVPGEYCKEPTLKNCKTASSADTVSGHIYPAYVRWCDSEALTNCQGAFSDTFRWARTPSPSTATITITGSSSTSVKEITVNNKHIMAAATSASTNSTTLAGYIVAQINACTVKLTGNCELRGYRAFNISRRDSNDSGSNWTSWYSVSSCTAKSTGSRRVECSTSNNVVTIVAPEQISYAPIVTLGNSGTMSFATTNFTSGTVPGKVLATVISPDVASYVYPNSPKRAATRTDCVGDTCTFQEEMTNYANWWAYYKSRMQMMKTAASHAFAEIDKPEDLADGISRFRLGYMTLNKNADKDFLNLGEFKGAQKYNWYNQLFKASPSSGTPLRDVLSEAGRLYAGKLNGAKIDDVTVTDPLQYSCQQNYSILSTDGFWNGGNGYKLNGSDDVENQDGGLDAPYSDGANKSIKKQTSRLRERSITLQAQKKDGTLQAKTSIDIPAPKALKSTKESSKKSWTKWMPADSCTPQSKTYPYVACQYPVSRSFDNGSTWNDWEYLDTNEACSPKTSGWPLRRCSGSIPGWGDWADVSNCSVSGSTQCRYKWTDWSNVDSCTEVAASDSSPYSVASARQCQSLVASTGSWGDTETSCTPSSTKECAYGGWTTATTVASCTNVPKSTPAPGEPYTVTVAVQCDIQLSDGTTNTLADVAAYYYSTDLRTTTPASAADATGTCTGPIIAPATTANDLCADNVPPSGRDVATHQHMTTFTLGLGAQGRMTAPTPGKDYWADTSGDFYDVRFKTTANPSAGTCSWQSSGTACTWPVPSADSNANIDDLWHAAVNGRGTYFSATSPETLASGLTDTLAKIVNTPKPGTAAAAASSNPNVSSSDNYVFSSSYKSMEWYGELIRQRITKEGTLSAQNWSAMRLLDCATTSWTANTSYAVGSVYKEGSRCYLVTSDYTSGATFDSGDAGTDGSKTDLVYEDATASTKVPVTPLASRTLYTSTGTKTEAGWSLISFDWDSLEDNSLDNYFSKAHIGGLSQFCTSGVACLSSTDQDAAAGEALVNYLRGERSHEGTYFRKRVHVLGDIVSSEGRYVKTPLFNYNDANYDDYKTLHADRKGVVYVGANDGMVHAFDATSGQELWAYVPSMVLPNLYKLADREYASKHEFYVDGTPETGDFCPKAPAETCDDDEWKTILVGGLNRGGKGYYALDVTNPDAPILLWEFTDTNLGYSYGNPRITKLKDGTWVVLLSSGYNNADGEGHLYVVRAKDGFLIKDISTGVGTAASPSGLARISAHAKTPMTDNTSSAAYGGDVFGNLWRFDINNDILPSTKDYEAHRLAIFKKGSKLQPVTVKPLEVTVGGKPIVFVGTGRFLGKTDFENEDTQSFYALRDNLDDTTYSDIRAEASKFVNQTLTLEKCPADAPASVCSPGEKVRTSSNKPVNWGTDNGWYMDYIGKGERSNTDPTLGLGALLLTTNAPSTASANACGKAEDTSASYLYQLDYLTGGSLDGYHTVVGTNLGAGLVTRPVLIKLDDGSVKALIRTSSTNLGDGTDMGRTEIKEVTPPGDKASVVRRVSWRELPTE